MKKRAKITIVLLVVSVVFSLSLYSFGRYISSFVKGYYLQSKGFYFESDLLKNDKEISNFLWDGNSVSFSLKNFESENLITDYDIKYDVSCEILTENINASCTINDTNSDSADLILSSSATCINTNDDVDTSSYNKTECEVKGYDWVKQQVVQTNFFNVNFENEEDINKEVDVKITASSTKPYKKTLSAIFKLQNNGSNFGKISKINNVYSIYSELIINNTYAEDKCVLVSFNSGNRTVDVSEEMSNLEYDSNDYVKRFKVNVPSNSSVNLMFFPKSADSDLSQDDISVEESSGC